MGRRQSYWGSGGLRVTGGGCFLQDQHFEIFFKIMDGQMMRGSDGWRVDKQGRGASVQSRGRPKLIADFS